MVEVTVISDETRVVDAHVSDGRILVDAAQLPDALGWELKPEGLCRDDVCVPVRDPAALVAGDRLDLEAVGAALGRPVVVDADAGVVAVALDGETRRRALSDCGAVLRASPTSTATRTRSRSGTTGRSCSSCSPPGEAVAMTCPGGRRCTTS